MNIPKATGIFAAACLLLAACTSHNSDTPDTEANRRGFERLTGLTATDEVSNVFLFADEWGGDSAYQLAFTAPPAIVEKIIEALALRPGKPSVSGGGNEFPWWNPQHLENLPAWHSEDMGREKLIILRYDEASSGAWLYSLSW